MGKRTEIKLTDDEREVLERWARRPKTAQALALRSRIVLGAAAGETSIDIAARLGCTDSTVGKWRVRFAERGIDGLHDEPRPGKPRTITDDDVERVIVKTLEEAPADATHWSTRSMAAATGLNQTAISRIWRAFGLKPHQTESFKLSPDPQFIDKVRDIVALYLNLPDAAVRAVEARVGLTAPSGRRIERVSLHVELDPGPARVGADRRQTRSPRGVALVLPEASGCSSAPRRALSRVPSANDDRAGSHRPISGVGRRL